MGKILLIISLLPAGSIAAVLRVGPERPYKTIRAAAAAVQDGDTIEVDRGVYSGDVATWRKNNLKVLAVGGRVHLRADGANESGKGIWVVQGSNFTVEGIEFSGASVPDQNGAGIRAEGSGTLTIRNCYFYNNQMGILTWNDPNSEVVIENSTFEETAPADGITHNIYIGRIRRFILRGCYSHKAMVGHNVKSRARQNYILYNRIMDEHTGAASYQIDLPEGGLSFIIGNVIQQGPLAENNSIIAYAAENANSGVLRLFVINNTIVNDKPGPGTFLQLRPGTRAVVVNNIFYGSGTTWSTNQVSMTASNNYLEPSHNNSPRFLNPQKYDYRILNNSPCVDAGIPPGGIYGFDMTPRRQYVYDAGSEERKITGNIDIGAFEQSKSNKNQPNKSSS